MTKSSAPIAKKRFFRGLDELRAIAALMVLGHHVELYKSREAAWSLYDTPLHHFISKAGENGVGLFFVLSGFLITYLLLAEKQALGTVKYRKFVWRRALRIWPLYYLIIVLSFFVVPALFEVWAPLQGEAHYGRLVSRVSTDISGPLGWFLIFAPNVALVLHPPVVGASQAWSIGVEEQFYLTWPLVLRWMTSRWLPFFFVGFVAFKIGFELYMLPDLVRGTSAQWLVRFSQWFRIEFMAIGALGAYLQFHEESTLRRIIHHPLVLMMIVFATIGLLTVKVHHGHYWIGLAFLGVILTQTTDSRLRMSSKPLGRLGAVSYGVYMYHPLMMYFSFAFIHSVLELRTGVAYHVAAYSSVLLSTLVISELSFRHFERPFLRFKDTKFATLHFADEEE